MASRNFYYNYEIVSLWKAEVMAIHGFVSNS